MEWFYWRPNWSKYSLGACSICSFYHKLISVLHLANAKKACSRTWIAETASKQKHCAHILSALAICLALSYCNILAQMEQHSNTDILLLLPFFLYFVIWDRRCTIHYCRNPALAVTNINQQIQIWLVYLFTSVLTCVLILFKLLLQYRSSITESHKRKPQHLWSETTGKSSEPEGVPKKQVFHV